MEPNYTHFKTFLFPDGDFTIEPTHEPVNGKTVFETHQQAIESLRVRISGMIRSFEKAEKKIERIIKARYN